MDTPLPLNESRSRITVAGVRMGAIFFETGGLGATLRPPVGPGFCPGRSPGAEAPESA